MVLLRIHYENESFWGIIGMDMYNKSSIGNYYEMYGWV